MQLFESGKPFFKGNTHCHTTRSDGRKSPEDVKALYREMGYDFLALTDHRRMGETTHMEDGMLVFSGIEMDYDLPGEVLHMIGFGMDESFSSEEPPRIPQKFIDLVHAHGGKVILAHPAWSLNTLATLSGLRGVTLAEMYNSVSTYPWNADRADSSGILDVAAAHRTFYNFVAADDSHFYEGEAGRAFTMVQADELTQESLFAALDAGRFYCSQGPAIHQVNYENGVVSVECSPAERVIFYSNLPWTKARCVTGSGLTTASYTAYPERSEFFVRVQVMDAQGRSAWCNPILL